MTRVIPALSISVAAALSVAVGPAPAQAVASGYAGTSDCREHQAFVDGDAAAVAARLPKKYEAVGDPSSGQPLLFVRALQCRQVTLDGRSAPATMASFGVVIESPDGRGCASGVPVLGSVKGDVPPACNWYTLFWLADDRRVVDWLRDATPDFPAVYVPGLVFDLGAFDPARGGAPFHFEAPAPAPSPFTVDEIAREHPGELSVRGGYWADTAEGTVKLAFSTDDLTTGDATGIVHATPGSEMARLFGADERSYAQGYSQIAAERWAHASYRRQLLGPAGPGEELDSFAGSCSVQGTNVFAPPITTAEQQLSLDYRASGTCSGTLDGRSVSNAPVEMHQTGTSDGSCLRARTLVPAQGALTFADGTTIRYTFDFTFVLSEGTIEWYGERSGTGQGHGSFATQRTPSDVASKCIGEGNPALPLDISLKTDSPLVSARRANAGVARSRLKLSVRPSSVTAGRRVVLTFRVTTSSGRPVPGALIRFARRATRAGRTGSARMVVSLARPGRWIARATKPGFGTALATVRSRRR